MARHRHRVTWSPAAAADLAEWVSRTARRSGAEAGRLLSRVRAKAAALERVSLDAPIVPELASVGAREWRELAIEPGRILYRVAGDEVRVGAVIDDRRDLEDLLLERLVR